MSSRVGVAGQGTKEYGTDGSLERVLSLTIGYLGLYRGAQFEAQFK
jgi:hypothetical protein